MIDAKAAFKAGVEFLAGLYPESPIVDPRLEEVELSGDERNWIITISYSDDARVNEMIKSVTGKAYLGRTFKELTVSADDGRVRSMKMRIMQV
jgi:hypothetical protein